MCLVFPLLRLLSITYYIITTSYYIASASGLPILVYYWICLTFIYLILVYHCFHLSVFAFFFLLYSIVPLPWPQFYLPYSSVVLLLLEV